MADPEHDGRWCLLRVSNDMISMFFRGEAVPADTDAPADLCVINLHRIRPGPNGEMTYVIWSASFDPLPMTDEGRLAADIPFVDFVYRRKMP